MNKIAEIAMNYEGKLANEIRAKYPCGAWCAATVCCILDDCGIDVYKSISCTQMANQWANDSRMVLTDVNGIQNGSVIFFDWDGSGDCDHVGIVVDFDGDISTGCYYINGNGNDGNTVTRQYMSYAQLKQYAARIFNYIGDVEKRPTEPKQTSSDNLSMTFNQIEYGACGSSVKVLQSLLIASGYSCGPCGADGEFGNDTKCAVMNYQREHGLDADGIVGPQTWTNLLR